MFFKLMNASANFQYYINKTLHLFLNVFVFVYLNDILIYTKNERTYVDENNLLKKHINQIKSILKKLKKFDLYVKFNKCRFYAKKIDFLNFQIFSINVSMQKNWMSTMQNWFMSCSHRNIQTFINFVNFYRQLINEFFKITANLIDLLKNAINEKFSFKFKMIVKKNRLNVSKLFLWQFSCCDIFRLNSKHFSKRTRQISQYWILYFNYLKTKNDILLFINLRKWFFQNAIISLKNKSCLSLLKRANNENIT